MKGKKAVAGEPMTQYGETKERINITLTPTAIALLDEHASLLDISRSELIERLARDLGKPKTPAERKQQERVRKAAGVELPRCAECDRALRADSKHAPLCSRCWAKTPEGKADAASRMKRHREKPA